VAKLDIAHINPSVVASKVKSTYKLPSQEQNGLHHELKTRVSREGLKGWAKVVECHYIEARFCAKPKHKRDACPSVKPLVDRELVF